MLNEIQLNMKLLKKNQLLSVILFIILSLQGYISSSVVLLILYLTFSMSIDIEKKSVREFVYLYENKLTIFVYEFVYLLILFSCAEFILNLFGKINGMLLLSSVTLAILSICCNILPVNQYLKIITFSFMLLIMNIV